MRAQRLGFWESRAVEMVLGLLAAFTFHNLTGWP